MKKIDINKTNEKIYYYKLDNGMDVYFYIKEKFNNNYVTFSTKFGSINNEFIPIGKKKFIKVPNGIQHFLEHKVFANEVDPQPPQFFSDNGANYNAHTSLRTTVYEFSGPKKLEENLSFLLNYVQQPYFTDENVKVEKGIITEEINMCNDNPWNILYDKIRYNSFINNPIRESIAGEINDIEKITPDMLLTCYKTFYHPSNMILIVTGNFNPSRVLDVIIDNQNKKDYSKNNPITLKEIDEPDKVYKEFEIINHDTEIPKCAYNIKISFDLFDLSKRKIMLYTFIIFKSLFDGTSLFNEKMKEKQIITNTVSLEILNGTTHLLVSLINETNKYNELITEIRKTIKNINITNDDLERKKKVLISNYLFSFNNLELINDILLDDIIFSNKVCENMIDEIESLNYVELTEFIKKLDCSNNSTVIIDKIKKND